MKYTNAKDLVDEFSGIWDGDVETIEDLMNDFILEENQEIIIDGRYNHNYVLWLEEKLLEARNEKI